MKVRLEYRGEQGEQHETDWIEIVVGKHSYTIKQGTQKPDALRIVAETGTSPATHIIPLLSNVIEIANPSTTLEEWQAQQHPAPDTGEGAE